jgi:hypothetical protein
MLDDAGAALVLRNPATDSPFLPIGAILIDPRFSLVPIARPDFYDFMVVANLSPRWN